MARKPHTPETRAKISATQRGRTVTPETRAKISAAARGRTVTPETRAKMSAAARRRKGTPETRDLSDAQFADYRLFKRKAYNRQEAAALARGETVP